VDVLVEFKKGQGPIGMDIVHTEEELSCILGAIRSITSKSIS
jgi:hypothetical protein